MTTATLNGGATLFLTTFTFVAEPITSLPSLSASPVRLDVRKGEALKEGSEVIGSATKVKVVKNKVAPPFKVAVVNMIFGQGISHIDEVISLAVENDIIEKAGAWFSYKGEKLGQGFNSVREYMKNHPEFDAEITELVKAKLFPTAEVDSTEIPAE